MGFHPNDFNLWSSKFPTILWIRRVERGTQISGLGYKLQFSAHPHLTDMAFLGLLCLRGTSLQDWIFIFSLFDESEKPQKINGDDLQFFAFSPLVFLTPWRLDSWLVDILTVNSRDSLVYNLSFSTLFFYDELTWVTWASALRDERGLRSDTLDWLLVAFPVNGSDDCSAFQF